MNLMFLISLQQDKRRAVFSQELRNQNKTSAYSDQWNNLKVLQICFQTIWDFKSKAPISNWKRKSEVSPRIIKRWWTIENRTCNMLSVLLNWTRWFKSLFTKIIKKKRMQSRWIVMRSVLALQMLSKWTMISFLRNQIRTILRDKCKEKMILIREPNMALLWDNNCL